MNKYSELSKEIKLQDDVNTLLDVNEELRKIIDKAIEYIEEKYYDDLFDDTLTQFQDKLLSILRGEENGC